MASGAQNIVGQKIKYAIEENSVVDVAQWLMDYRDHPGLIDAIIIPGPNAAEAGQGKGWQTPLQYAGRMGREEAAKALIEAGANATPALQDAGLRRDARAVRILIAAGAKVTADLNEYTKKFQRPAGAKANSAPYHQNLFEQMLAVCQAAQSHDSSRPINVKLNTEVSNMRDLLGRPEWNDMEQFIIAQNNPQMGALWEVMQLFKTEFITCKGNFVKLKKSCSDFLYRVTLLSSPLLQAANTVGVLANKAANQREKVQLRRIQGDLEQHVQSGQTNSYAENCVLAQVRLFAANFAANKAAANSPNIDKWNVILGLSGEAWEVLGLLQNEWVQLELGEIPLEQLSNTHVLADSNLVKFLKDSIEKHGHGKTEQRSPEYVAMLTALHTLFQRNPELGGYRVIQSVQPTADKLDDAAKMAAVTAEINGLYNPTADLLHDVDQTTFTPKSTNRLPRERIEQFEQKPKPASDLTHVSRWQPPPSDSTGKTPKADGKKGSRKTSSPGKSPASSSSGTGNRLDPERLKRFEPQPEPDPDLTHGPGWKRPPLVSKDGTPKADIKKWRKTTSSPEPKTDNPPGTDKGSKRLENKPGRNSTRVGANGQHHRVRGGSIGDGTALPVTDQARLSSFYEAAKKIYGRLTVPGLTAAGLTAPGEGYKYFSLPEMELFKTIKELKVSPALQAVIMDGKTTIWDTLNPKGAGVFKVSQLIDAENGQTQSPLERAMALHEQYKQEFKTSLSQRGGTYRPANKNYYFQKGIDNRYHLMVKAGKILSKEEKEEAIRELLIITRDMEGKIDVNVQIHSAVAVTETKDLAAIITVLGATVDKTQNVAKKDKSIHKAVEKHATTMQETAVAPEFAARSVKDKQKELWQTVRNTEMGPVVKASYILNEIEQKDYRLMSAEGVRKMPEVNKVTEKDKLAYWEKKSELLSRPEWNYIDASDIVKDVLLSIKEEVSLGQKPATGAAAAEPEAKIELSDGVVAHLMPFNVQVREDIRVENRARSVEWSKRKTQRDEQYLSESSAWSASSWQGEEDESEEYRSQMLTPKKNSISDTDGEDEDYEDYDEEEDEKLASSDNENEFSSNDPRSESLLKISRRVRPDTQALQQAQNQPLSVNLASQAPDAAVPTVHQPKVPTTSSTQAAAVPTVQREVPTPSPQVPAVTIVPRPPLWSSASTRPKTSIAREPIAREPQEERINGFEQIAIEQAKIASRRAQEEYERKNGPIGSRNPDGFVMAGVDDDGNCFYYALEDQLRLLKSEQYFHGVQSTKVHLELRQQVNPKSKPGDWAVEEDIGVAARKFNCCIAVYRTNTPDELGFECHYINDNGDKKFTYDINDIPAKLQGRIVRLIHTGNHFDSVRAHPQIPVGALRAAYSALSASHPASPRASQSPTFFSSSTGSTNGEGKGNQNMKSAVSLKMTLSQNGKQ